MVSSFSLYLEIGVHTILGPGKAARPQDVAVEQWRSVYHGLKNNWEEMSTRQIEQMRCKQM